VLKAFVTQAGVGVADSETSSWDVFHALLSDRTLSRSSCTDAHLAALAIARGWRLVSFDRDFRQFAGLSWLQLP
jgi:hypothetical protein